MKGKPDAGIILWDDLTVVQKEQFVAAFMRDEARFARIHKAAESKGGKNEFVASTLSLHQGLKRLKRKLDNSFDEQFWHGSRERAQELSDLISEIEGGIKEAESRIFAMFKLWLWYGDWDHFKWLAKYGSKHAPKGISPNQSDGETSFPNSFSIPNARKEPCPLAQVILWEFAELTGCDVRLFVADPHYPPGTLSGVEGLMHRGRTGKPEPKPGIRDWLLPPRLPTKKRLRQSVWEVWEGTNGFSTANLDSQFSKELKTLGFDGLPQSRRGLGEDGGYAG
jgi:hypothetical protein